MEARRTPPFYKGYLCNHTKLCRILLNYAKYMIDLSQFHNDAKIKPVDFRDYRLENIPALAAILPPVFSLRNKIAEIKNQGTSSSCVAQATAYYVQLLNFLETNTQVEMSARDIYSLIHLPGGGAYIADAFKKITQSGCVVEAEAPSHASDG